VIERLCKKDSDIIDFGWRFKALFIEIKWEYCTSLLNVRCKKKRNEHENLRK
jgi:hypothetical protein